MKYRVVEKFVSINGEGISSGKLAVFIRFAGCNLNCSYCDTLWANEDHVSFEWLDEDEIHDYIKSTGIHHVTLTGGEPLLQDGILSLLKDLSKDMDLSVEIETNGSIYLEPFIDYPLRFTMDYKLGTSHMEEHMKVENFNLLTKKDTVKFVAGSMEDLKRAKEIIDEYDLIPRTTVYLSPVFGRIPMDQIVEFMKENKMNGVTLQVQLHKVIWEPERRGV